MGGAMAANLAMAGHAVKAWNRTPGKHVEGAEMASTPAEAARDAEAVWMCVSDAAGVEQILFGQEGVVRALRAGVIVADSSTISPEATQRFSARVRASGADYVDAPVTGSKLGAESAQLIFIVGGRDESLAKLEPLFHA